MNKPTRPSIKPQPSSASVQRKGNQPQTRQAQTKPAAPPAYQPQTAPRCLQPKAATPRPAAPGQVKAPPSPPPVYRPQPTPKVLQAKRPNPAPSAVQPKVTRAHPDAPPAYRPQSMLQVSQPQNINHQKAPFSSLSSRTPTMSHGSLPQSESHALQRNMDGLARPSSSQSIHTPLAPMPYRPNPMPKTLQMNAPLNKFAPEKRAGQWKPVASTLQRLQNRATARPGLSARTQYRRSAAVIQPMIIPIRDLEEVGGKASLEEIMDAQYVSKATGFLEKTRLHGEVKRFDLSGETKVLSKLGKTEDLIIVSHGGSEENVNVARVVGGYTPEKLAGIVVSNGLGTSYKGVIYVNGCETAAPWDNGESFISLFQKALAKRKRYVRVKGNVGGSQVLNDGRTIVAQNTKEARHNISLVKNYSVKTVKLNEESKAMTALWDKVRKGEEKPEQLIEKLGIDKNADIPTIQKAMLKWSKDVTSTMLKWRDEAHKIHSQTYSDDSSLTPTLPAPPVPMLERTDVRGVFLALMVALLIYLYLQRRSLPLKQ